MSLESVRTQATATLTAAGFKAADYVAETVTPPIAVVVPADPYITTDEVTFGHVNVNLSVLLVGGKGTNKAAASKIDQMIADAYAALSDADWDITEVTQPGQVNLSGSTYLGAVISITTETKI